jgi:preprotein translocase subunit Sec61beta
MSDTVTPAGLAFPVTPSGESSLLNLWTDPSQRVVGDALWIGFEADPDVVREFTPAPLEPDSSGLLYLYAFNGFAFSDRNLSEFVSPERVNFTETMFWVPCTCNGEFYIYTPFTWTNRDYLAYFGRLLGMPQKWGKVQMTPFHPGDPLYSEPHEGVRVCISVENVGLVVRGYLDIRRGNDRMPFRMENDYCPKFAGRRHFFDIVRGEPAVDDLVVHWATGLNMGPVWAGDAWLRFYEAENEEAIRFQPRRVLGGWFVRQSFTHAASEGHPFEVLHDYLAASKGVGNE